MIHCTAFTTRTVLLYNPPHQTHLTEEKSSRAAVRLGALTRKGRVILSIKELISGLGGARVERSKGQATSSGGVDEGGGAATGIDLVRSVGAES